jgi:hypothetical protein
MEEIQMFDSEERLTPEGRALVKRNCDADQAAGLYEKCETCDLEGGCLLDAPCPHGYPPEGPVVLLYGEIPGACLMVPERYLRQELSDPDWQ